MNSRIRIAGALCASAVVVALASVPAAAQLSDEQVRCRATIGKAGTKLAKTALKSFATCHKLRNADASLESTDCNSIETGDLKDRIPAAVASFEQKVADACSGQDPAGMLYEGCPVPCAASVPSLGDVADLADCLSCVTTSAIEDLSATVFTEPDPTLETNVAACHRSITSAASKLATSILKAVTRCQASAEKGGTATVEGCTETSYDSLVADALAEATTFLETRHCSAISLPDTRLDACDTPGSVTELSGAVVEATDASAHELAGKLLSLPAENATTSTTVTTTSTSTTLPPGDPLCPSRAELTWISRDTDQTCETDGDCAAPRTCNEALGKCQGVTDIDLGWAGYVHDVDSNDGDVVPLFLHCEGPAGPTCGQCQIAGIDPAAAHCRCANDSRVLCDEPFSSSSADCGGAACNCYLGAPMPVGGGGTPLCVVPRLATNLTGTIDVDTGDVSLVADVRLLVHLGQTVRQPCPSCGGTCSNNPATLCDHDDNCGAGTCNFDPVANDGIRGGVCVGTGVAGLSCDVMATNASFPAYRTSDGPSGAGYSLDCLPNNNVSGTGLRLGLDLGTDVTTLGSNVSCGGLAPEIDCACRVCSAEPTVGCSSDAECAAQRGSCTLSAATRCDDDGDCESQDAGACMASIHRCQRATSLVCATNADCDFVDLGTCTPSTCSANGVGGFGEYPLPNSCGDFTCNDLGGGEGECPESPGTEARYCDGVVKADGRGLFACFDDEGCDVNTVGIAAGQCSITEQLACFPDPIEAAGSASPDWPVLADAYCMPPTSSAGINTVAGLVGPARLEQQTRLVTYCASDPSTAYTPGVGGCP